MEEVESRRSVTPNEIFDAWLNRNPTWDHESNPSEKCPTSSPHDSFGGNVSSLSSRNSSLSRSQSKASLRSVFSRGRSASVASQRLDTSSSRGRPATTTTTTKHSRHSSSATIARAESPHLSQIGSRLDSYRPTHVTHAAHIDRARSNQQRTRRRSSPTWDPPPLFQAYPQSLKHITLDASCLSTDVILRKSPYRDGHTHNETAKAGSMDSQNLALLTKKARDGSNKHARKLSASISGSGWTKYLFVLVDSGYLLQYTGSGRLDRLPEKMLQLGRDTVAFASDAIPGRHWVLQISQSAGEDGIVFPGPSKGLLSRIGVQSGESRRMTKNFLMVFDNSEDLDSWLTIIRKEVEALGGREYRCETPTELEAQYLRAKSTQEDAYHFPGSKFGPTHQVLSPVESELPENEGGPVDDHMLKFRFWDNEATSPHASENSSIIASAELERLRDSKGSSGSTGTGTSTSFHGRLSPGVDKPALKPFPFFESVDLPVVLGAQSLAPQGRESTLAEPPSPSFLCHALDEMDVEGDAQKATCAGPSYARKLHKVTPNFSVPTSSNRFSFFGSTEALTLSPIGGILAPTSATPEDNTFDDESAESDHFSRRPVSTIAPLPTPEALMNPTGTRKRNSRRLSVEKGQPLPSGLDSYDYTDMSGWPTAFPARRSSLENTMSMLSAPLPSPPKELPALPRSKSHQGLCTFDSADTVQTRTTFPPRIPRGQTPRRPLSLSGFPEPPSCAQPDASSRDDKEAPKSSLLPKPLALSSKTRLPIVTVTPAPAGVNPRLSKIRESRGVPRLGVTLPSGPPPSCPLPDTPSPRKRKFSTVSKRDSHSERDGSKVLVPSRRILKGATPGGA